MATRRTFTGLLLVNLLILAAGAAGAALLMRRDPAPLPIPTVSPTPSPPASTTPVPTPAVTPRPSAEEQDVADLYLMTESSVRQAISGRRLEEAASILRDFLFRSWSEALRPFVRREGVDYAALEAACGRPPDRAWNWERVEVVAGAGAGDPASPIEAGLPVRILLDLRNVAALALFRGQVEEGLKRAAAAGERETWTLATWPGERCWFEPAGLRVGGRPVALDLWSGLREPDHVQLAARSLDADPERAKEKSLTDPALLLRSALHLHFSPAGDVYGAGAAELFARAAKAGATGARLYHARIEDLRKADREAAEVYRARVETLPGGQRRILYDFEDAGQLEAFEVLALKGKWSLDRGAIGSSGDRCAIRWRPKVKGDLSVEYDLTPVDPPQNLSVDLYWVPGASRHYALTFGLDVAFGRDDPGNDAEDRNGLPRTCLLKYPLPSTLQGWDSPETWKALRGRLVGAATAPGAPSRGNTSRVRIERAGSLLTLLLDGRRLWSGEDAEYGEGHVLFYADSRARIDNLAITISP